MYRESRTLRLVGQCGVGKNKEVREHSRGNGLSICEPEGALNIWEEDSRENRFFWKTQGFCFQHIRSKISVKYSVHHSERQET